MTVRRLPEEEVDRLLRDALTGDVPPRIEDDLRVIMRRSWRRLGAEARRVEAPRLRWAVAVSQPLLATAALSLLAAGGAMQAAGAPRAVAESLSMTQTSILVSRALSRAAAMEGTVETRDERGARVRVRVTWRPGEATTLRIEGGEVTTETRLPAREPGASVLDLRAARTRAAVVDAGLGDPAVRPVENYFSPRGLVDLLAGTWALGESRVAGMQRYLVESRTRPVRLRVLVDERTHLPANIEEEIHGGPGTNGETGTKAVFQWSDSPAPLQERVDGPGDASASFSRLADDGIPEMHRGEGA